MGAGVGSQRRRGGRGAGGERTAAGRVRRGGGGFWRGGGSSASALRGVVGATRSVVVVAFEALNVREIQAKSWRSART